MFFRAHKVFDMSTITKIEFCEEENRSSFAGQPPNKKQKYNDSSTGLNSTPVLIHKYPAIEPSGEKQEFRLAALS